MQRGVWPVIVVFVVITVFSSAGRSRRDSGAKHFMNWLFKKLIGMILVGSLLWLLHLSGVAKAVADWAWEIDGVQEFDRALQDFALIALLPLGFSESRFVLVVSDVPPRRNEARI